MNILRTLERAWLGIAIFTFCMAMYQIFSEDISSGLLMLGGTVVAFMFYLMRKKQRIRIEREQNKEDATVNYH